MLNVKIMLATYACDACHAHSCDADMSHRDCKAQVHGVHLRIVLVQLGTLELVCKRGTPLLRFEVWPDTSPSRDKQRLHPACCSLQQAPTRGSFLMTLDGSIAAKDHPCSFTAALDTCC